MKIIGAIFGIIVGLFLIVIAFRIAIFLIKAAISGAVVIFAYASEQGFIGIAVCLACFVFMFPILIIISIIIGVFTLPSNIPNASPIDSPIYDNNLEVESIIKKIQLRRSMQLDVELLETELKELQDNRN